MSFWNRLPVLVPAILVLWAVSPALGQQAPVKHALLIGIDRYVAEIENVPRLDFARADAEKLAGELDRRGWDTRALLDDSATRRGIVQELTRLAAVAKSQDTVLIYFAGHGLRDKLGRGHTYWLTYPSTLSSLAVDALRLTHLMEYVGDISAGRKVVILDHCHSGDVERLPLGQLAEGTGPGPGLGPQGAGSGARGGIGRPQVTRNLFPMDGFRRTVQDAGVDGLVVLGSARDDAYEFPDLGHGMFTYGLLKALGDPDADANQDGMLSIQELWIFAKGEMDRQAQSRGVVQEAIEVTGGINISSWNDLFEAALGGDQDLATELDALQQFLIQLDLGVSELNLSTAEQQAWIKVRATCFAALLAWHAALSSDPPQEPDRTDLDLVNEMKGLSQLAGFSPQIKKTMLETKVRGLTGSAGDTP